MNSLRRLQEFGQSVYLDEISRGMLTDGTLETMIERDGLRGVTSNPAIFEKAIAQSNEYDDVIARLQAEGQSVDQIYEELVIADIQAAADLFRPLYEETDGRYGYVSLEVNPHLANDTEGTVEEARHLWRELARPNVFIKVPGTKAGIPAIRTLISEGINVNVTLLFSLDRYRESAQAYIEGLQERVAAGHDIHRVASVASFFLSRIDVAIDPRLAQIADSGGANADLAAGLQGRIAVANAKMAYQAYLGLIASKEFRALEAQGARPQRLLWASTGTKNPEYSDVMYVEPLIGPDPVNALPRDTLDAYRDHGEPADRIRDGVDEAREALEQLGSLGISLDEVTGELEREGVDKFVKPFDSLMKTLEQVKSPR